MTDLQKIADQVCFGGRQQRYQMTSASLQGETRFGVYLPPQAAHGKVPALFWLSGLTCTDENFVQKAGAQQYAAKHGLALITPDTSPRGEGVADDAEGAYDLGLGAGFYLDATQAPWREHYKMQTFVADELYNVIVNAFPIDADNIGISGHSMGGHGAITLGLKYADRFTSISAFAPICAPAHCAWGQKAFGAYLGNDTEAWQAYDSAALVEKLGLSRALLIDQGSDDEFLADQLQPDLLRAACENSPLLNLRMQAGYDHSYFFIASFIEDHIAFHADQLKH